MPGAEGSSPLSEPGRPWPDTLPSASTGRLEELGSRSSVSPATGLSGCARPVRRVGTYSRTSISTGRMVNPGRSGNQAVRRCADAEARRVRPAPVASRISPLRRPTGGSGRNDGRGPRLTRSGWYVTVGGESNAAPSPRPVYPAAASTRLTFWPPKPKLLDSANSTDCARASLGTTSSSMFGSGSR